MAPSPSSRQPRPATPNIAFRRIRGDLSPGEFSAAVRRAAREIGERVSCDARYIGRVESGQIRCPNYAYERVFKHMFPGYSLVELGFAPRDTVRGRNAAKIPDPRAHDESFDESRDGYPALITPASPAVPPVPAAIGQHRIGTDEVRAVEESVRQIRLLDDRHGADGLYQHAGHALRGAYALLDQGAFSRPVADRLYAGSGELAISVGWLAHDSGRHGEARSYYAEALATARAAADPWLEAHAFCNTSFLARDDNRPREAVRAAQAAQQAAARLGSSRLLSLLALREAGGWAVLRDRAACERSLVRAQQLYAHGTTDADPGWMTFYGEAEMAGLEAQAWCRLGDHRRAVAHAARAVELQDQHFTRNIALYNAELAAALAASGEPDEAAAAGNRVLDLLGERVRSSRIKRMLAGAAGTLRPHRPRPAVAHFLSRHDSHTRGHDTAQGTGESSRV